MRDAVELRMQARKMGLKAPDAFWEFRDQERLNKIWNGYGPDRWPACVRSAMTVLYFDMEPPAEIHDFEYEFSDGTLDGWQAADDRIAENMKIQIDYEYPLWKVWLWPLRVIALGKRKAAIDALSLGGYTAWVDAFKRRCNA